MGMLAVEASGEPNTNYAELNALVGDFARERFKVYGRKDKIL